MPALTSRRAVLTVFGVAATWWIALGVMAALTSNPPVLNVAQVLEARLIVEARATNTDDSIEIIHVFTADKLDQPSGTITVVNLKDVITTLQSNDSCLVPLSPTGEGAWKIPGWQFVDKGRTTSIPVVYPANDATRNRLKQILERAKRQILDRPIGIERHFVQLSAR